MKKGFTLVELLAVITLLAVVGMIAMPVVSKSIESSKEKAYNAQVKEVEKAAASWASEHQNEIFDTDINCVDTEILNIKTITVENLMNLNYIPKDAKNPKTDEVLTGSVKITYDCGYNSFNYKYEE